MISRSGFLSRLLKDAKDVTLPSECPGGPEIFELVANFCYGSTILMEPSNVAELCCVAEFLQMSEEYGRANLSERSNLYLTQVSKQLNLHIYLKSMITTNNFPVEANTLVES